ncbi:tRNA (adenine(22)-N(1))-methyltransferase [Melghiribacillus thermohalophilus]|uniref:tRNA (adenine(22)-N(1))-methyltransferase n=1 Tax=Melghiribacillus thermohalophilus TaxID=1324956 RepID=UPI001404EB03|nr:tRNA (adenine(22)-N(1))-methyltransferase TrmK [Melghiribacillus thermohalophilus]
MDQLNLSQRLKQMADSIPEGSRFADIGTDHAYLPCYVCLKDPKATAIAGELNDGPYAAALQQVKDLNLTDRIDVRQGDGLSILSPGEADTVVIAGMGGKLITSILDQGQKQLTETKHLILQPNLDASVIREWLIHHQYSLKDEMIINEDGYFYEILAAEKNDRITPDSLTDRELYFGPILLKKKGEVFRAKWRSILHKKLAILEQMEQAAQPDYEKISTFRTQAEWIKEVLNHE